MIALSLRALLLLGRLKEGKSLIERGFFREKKVMKRQRTAPEGKASVGYTETPWCRSRPDGDNSLEFVFQFG